MSGATGVEPSGYRDIGPRMPNPDGSGEVLELELLPEMGLYGPARVEQVLPIPAIKPGAGRVVLATVTHLNSQVIALRLHGARDVLEPTASHRLFSRERGGWTPAGELTPGEHLATREGDIAIDAVERKSGVERVWNLEVESEHSYLVAKEGVLSHNENPCAAAAGAGAPTIARILPGSLPAAEEAALRNTLSHIDAGTQPVGALAKKWGTTFRNWGGDLPGASGAASPFREFRVAPPAGMSGAGPFRIVTNSSTGEMYFTWTHYGDMGAPAFVKIR